MARFSLPAFRAMRWFLEPMRLRWYFRSDGTLESIDFPQGLHRVRSDLQQIRLGFGGDARMVP